MRTALAEQVFDFIKSWKETPIDALCVLMQKVREQEEMKEKQKQESKEYVFLFLLCGGGITMVVQK